MTVILDDLDDELTTPVSEVIIFVPDKSNQVTTKHKPKRKHKRITRKADGLMMTQNIDVTER